MIWCLFKLLGVGVVGRTTMKMWGRKKKTKGGGMCGCCFGMSMPNNNEDIPNLIDNADLSRYCVLFPHAIRFAGRFLIGIT
jgi:hypothetical protein